MKKRILLAAMSLATVAIAAQAGEIVMYENPGLQGRELVVRGHTPNIRAAGFSNRNASVLVRSGTWEVCAEPNFRGFCAKLQPNEYRSLDTRFNERISSAREIGAPVTDAGPVYGRAGSIEMFSRGGYRGRSITLDHSTPDFDALRFNDRASSLIVHRGTWELCSDDRYRGTCQVFERGRYTDLGPLTGDISSARMLRGRESRYRGG